MLQGTHSARSSYPALVPVRTEEVGFSDLPGRAADLRTIDQIIAPLFGDGFDAYELIGLLGEAKFAGRLSVVAEPLPNRGMVLRELRAVAEPLGIAVDLHERPARSGLAARSLRRLRG